MKFKGEKWELFGDVVSGDGVQSPRSCRRSPASLSAQIRRALRPSKFTPTAGGFRYAVDLVRFVRERGGFSIGAAGYVWSKAPGLIRIYEQGAIIRSRRGLYLAIPTPAAPPTRASSRLRHIQSPPSKIQA